MSEFLDQLQRRVIRATQEKTPLYIHGAGSKAFYGGAPAGEPVSLKEWKGIMAYEPSELYVSVRAGTPLVEVEEHIGRLRQMLAFEPLRTSPYSTIGGVVAAGLAGPRRATAGGIRDFILGATVMDGNGNILHFGGQVMKNVAGYDLSRAMAGSMGTLGILLDVTLKILPRPLDEVTFVYDMDEDEATQFLNTQLGKPYPISGSCYHQGKLWMRCTGPVVAVGTVRRNLGGHEYSTQETLKLWYSLRDHDHPFFLGAPNIFRISVPPTTPALNLPGDTLVEWMGGQRWYKPSEDMPLMEALALARGKAHAAGGHVAVFRTDDPALRAQAFSPIAPAVLDIQKRLKKAFDPAGIFNPGRMAPLL